MFVCVYQGKSRDKVGLFPANFVQRVRPGERVWKVTDGFHGNRDKGQMTVKEAQVNTHNFPLSLLHTHTVDTFLNLCKFMQKTAEITEDSMLWLPNAAHFFLFRLSPQTLSHY